MQVMFIKQTIKFKFYERESENAFLFHTYLASMFVSVLKKNTELYSISIGYKIQYRLF